MKKTFNKGSSILIEVETTKRMPFGSDVLFDPASVTIQVYDPNKTKKIDNSMIKKDTGQYYFIVQTDSNWIVGSYTTIINIQDSGASDVTVFKSAFRLI